MTDLGFGVIFSVKLLFYSHREPFHDIKLACFVHRHIFILGKFKIILTYLKPSLCAALRSFFFLSFFCCPSSNTAFFRFAALSPDFPLHCFMALLPPVVVKGNGHFSA